MDFDRRKAMVAGLGAMVAANGTTARSATPTTVTVTVQGEAAVRTNIPVRRDRRASGGRYLALRTAGKPPGGTGWYATYTVRVPQAGVYALTAVATAPVETPHTEAVASYLQLSVNDGPFTEIARSQPHWYESPPAWGDLSVLDLGVLELRGGAGTFTFRVTEPTALDDTTAYVLSLDRFTLRRLDRPPALRELTVPGTARANRPGCVWPSTGTPRARTACGTSRPPRPRLPTPARLQRVRRAHLAARRGPLHRPGAPSTGRRRGIRLRQRAR